MVFVPGFQQQHTVPQLAIAAVCALMGDRIVDMISPAADMVARVRQEITAIALDDLGTFRPVVQPARLDGLAAHVDFIGAGHLMHADALMAGAVEPAAAVVIHKDAAVNADAQVVADDLEGAQRAVRHQQIVSAATRRGHHPELACVIGDLRCVSADGAGLRADKAIVVKADHIIADPALDARLAAVAGAIEVEASVITHQEGVADLPAIPQVSQRIRVSYIIADHKHPPLM